MRLNGRTILITGGASGIGFELARQLTDLDNEVIITGRDAAKLAIASQRIPSLRTIRSDISDPSSIQTLAEEVVQQAPNLDVLVNNAGIMRMIDLDRTPASLLELTQEIETNLTGTIRMTAQFLPHLKARPDAAIVNVASGLAYVPLPAAPVYCAAKAGLHSFTRSLRVQLEQSKISVFELLPPATRTALLAELGSTDGVNFPTISVEDLASAAIAGIRAGRTEIAPGQSGQLRLMSRVAPNFIFRQLAKSTSAILGRTAVAAEQT